MIERFNKIDGYFDTLFKQYEINRNENLLSNERLSGLESRVELLESKSTKSEQDHKIRQ